MSAQFLFAFVGGFVGAGFILWGLWSAYKWFKKDRNEFKGKF